MVILYIKSSCFTIVNIYLKEKWKERDIIMNKKQGHFLVFIAGVLWGFIGVFVKYMDYNGANVETISFLRVTFALFIMVTFFIVKFGIRKLIIDKKTICICALLGIICHGVYNICYSAAVTFSGVTVSAVLLDIAPVFTLCFSVILFKEKINGRKIIAIIINIFGCILAVTNGDFQFYQMTFIGIVFGIGAGLCYSLTAIISKFASKKTDPFIISIYSYFFAMIFLCAYMIFAKKELIINSGIISWGFLYALIPTAIGYLIYYKGIEKIKESSKVPIIASVEVVIASFIGVIYYGEQVSLLSIFGIVLVLYSIFMMQIKGRILSKKCYKFLERERVEK